VIIKRLSSKSLWSYIAANKGRNLKEKPKFLPIVGIFCSRGNKQEDNKKKFKKRIWGVSSQQRKDQKNNHKERRGL
jgi:hypothetical protein